MKDNLSPNLIILLNDSYKSRLDNSDIIPQQPLTQKKGGEPNNIDIKNSNTPKDNLNSNSEEIIFSINIDSEMADKKDKKYIKKRARPKKKKKHYHKKAKKTDRTIK